MGTGDEIEPTVGIQFQVRLKRHIEYWEQVLTAPDHIIELIRDGYVLPLFSPHHYTWAAIINQWWSRKNLLLVQFWTF